MNIRYLLGLAPLICSTVLAETYTVDVDVDVAIGRTPLTVTQIQAMRFPQVRIDEATEIGAICYSSAGNSIFGNGAKATNVNSLCPDLTGSESQVEVSGVRNAFISLIQTAPAQTTNGIQFRVYESSTSVRLSGNEGKTITSLLGYITLQDKQAITSGLITFSYDVTAAYQ